MVKIHHVDQLLPQWRQLEGVIRTGHPVATTNREVDAEDYFAGFVESLDDIENNYLRETGDNRIHFVIVCASKGCPDLSPRIYNAETLDERLDEAARKYLSQPKGMVIEKDTGVVLLSMIFNWFGSDFGDTPAEVLKAFSRYLPDEQAEFLRENSQKVIVRYIDYDWSLNGD